MLIFFFKQKTAYEMRISDWSSDVCSSDLGSAGRVHEPALSVRRRHHDRRLTASGVPLPGGTPYARLSIWQFKWLSRFVTASIIVDLTRRMYSSTSPRIAIS